jgi:hypothetical protein
MQLTMRSSQCLAAVLLLIGTAAASPALAEPLTSDSAYSLVGAWSCRDPDTNGNGLATFTRAPDGSINEVELHRPARVIGLPQWGEFKNTYAFDASRGLWTWTSTIPGVHRFRETGTAEPWTSDVWTFEGTLQMLGRLPAYQPSRMQLVRVDDASFAREWEVSSGGGQWVGISRQICARSNSPRLP